MQQAAKQTSLEHYQNDLQLAADFQQAVLPRVIDIDYLDIALLYQPYDVVSGDVYDFILNRERELAIFIGDATGHGVAAALMTMMVHIAIDSLTPNLATDESMRRLNRLIASRNTGRSVSSTLFRITPKGLLTVTHAGHPSIIIVPKNKEELITFHEAGCALGLFIEEPVRYIEESYQLSPGDKIIAYTDGLIEWRNQNKEPYGMGRLMKCIQSNKSLDCEELKQTIYQDAKEFSKNNMLNDDLTILVAEYC